MAAEFGEHLISFFFLRVGHGVVKRLEGVQQDHAQKQAAKDDGSDTHGLNVPRSPQGDEILILASAKAA